MKRTFTLCLMALLLGACQSAYYEVAEQVGYHKRDILVDRVEGARDAQADAQEQFRSAQEQLLELTDFDGGDLKGAYDDLSGEYEQSAEAAQEVSNRIDAIEDVAGALFDEWAEEITQYSNTRLKSDSQRKLRDTQRRYEELLKVLRRSEKRMEPVLAALNDNVLYLKHNLNAQAVANLKVEFGRIDRDIDVLITEMRKSIEASDRFIESLQPTA
jgi:hypothetical protein